MELNSNMFKFENFLLTLRCETQNSKHEVPSRRDSKFELSKRKSLGFRY
jgi:hypothetical protein